MLFTCRCRTRCSALNVPSSIAPQRCCFRRFARADSILLTSRLWSGRGPWFARALRTVWRQSPSSCTQARTWSANSCSTLATPTELGRMGQRCQLWVMRGDCLPLEPLVMPWKGCPQPSQTKTPVSGYTRCSLPGGLCRPGVDRSTLTSWHLCHNSFTSSGT